MRVALTFPILVFPAAGRSKELTKELGGGTSHPSSAVASEGHGRGVREGRWRQNTGGVPVTGSQGPGGLRRSGGRRRPVETRVSSRSFPRSWRGLRTLPGWVVCSLGSQRARTCFTAVVPVSSWIQGHAPPARLPEPFTRCETEVVVAALQNAFLEANTDEIGVCPTARCLQTIFV